MLGTVQSEGLRTVQVCQQRPRTMEKSHKRQFGRLIGRNFEMGLFISWRHAKKGFGVHLAAPGGGFRTFLEIAFGDNFFRAWIRPSVITKSAPKKHVTGPQRGFECSTLLSALITGKNLDNLPEAQTNGALRNKESAPCFCGRRDNRISARKTLP